MKPVLQTITTVDPAKGIFGDCFRACIASILELPLDDVPHFVQIGLTPHPDDPQPLAEGNSDWWYYLRDWLRPRGLIYFDIPAGEDAPDALISALGYHTITGLSPRGDWQHVVVGRGGEIVHDPHPEGGGLRDRRLIGIFARTFEAAPPDLDRAAERLVSAMYLYPNYRVDSRGPRGCIADALEIISPEVLAEAPIRRRRRFKDRDRSHHSGAVLRACRHPKTTPTSRGETTASAGERAAAGAAARAER